MILHYSSWRRRERRSRGKGERFTMPRSNNMFTSFSMDSISRSKLEDIAQKRVGGDEPGFQVNAVINLTLTVYSSQVILAHTEQGRGFTHNALNITLPFLFKCIKRRDCRHVATKKYALERIFMHSCLAFCNGSWRGHSKRRSIFGPKRGIDITTLKGMMASSTRIKPKSGFSGLDSQSCSYACRAY